MRFETNHATTSNLHTERSSSVMSKQSGWWVWKKMLGGLSSESRQLWWNFWPCTEMLCWLADFKKSVVIPFVVKNPSYLNDYCPGVFTSLVMKVFECVIKYFICYLFPDTYYLSYLLPQNVHWGCHLSCLTSPMLTDYSNKGNYVRLLFIDYS